MDERDVMNKWRSLFRDKQVGPEVLDAAEELLDGMNGESPLHARLAKELEEIRELQAD
jgi:hypothetical protein